MLTLQLQGAGMKAKNINNIKNLENIKHDELCRVYKKLNEDGRETLIRVADGLQKAQSSIVGRKSALREEMENEGKDL
jgi:hypothetical protein